MEQMTTWFGQWNLRVIKAVAITYRGPVKHTNGLYNQLAIQHLNTLVGNYDWKDGCMAGGGGWGHKSGEVSLSKVAGRKVLEETVADEKNLPCLIAISALIGEVTQSHHEDRQSIRQRKPSRADRWQLFLL